MLCRHRHQPEASSVQALESGAMRATALCRSRCLVPTSGSMCAAAPLLKSSSPLLRPNLQGSAACGTAGRQRSCASSSCDSGALMAGGGARLSACLAMRACWTPATAQHRHTAAADRAGGCRPPTFPRRGNTLLSERWTASQKAEAQFVLNCLQPAATQIPHPICICSLFECNGQATDSALHTVTSCSRSYPFSGHNMV